MAGAKARRATWVVAAGLVVVVTVAGCASSTTVDAAGPAGGSGPSSTTAPATTHPATSTTGTPTTAAGAPSTVTTAPPTTSPAAEVGALSALVGRWAKTEESKFCVLMGSLDDVDLDTNVCPWDWMRTMRVQFDADGTASMSTQDEVSCRATWQATETRLTLSDVTCDPDVGVDGQSLDVELVLEPRATAGTGQDCFAVGGALGLPFCRVD